VGISDIQHLQKLQLSMSTKDSSDQVLIGHRTRNTPRRMSQLLDGGSLYWVIGGFICARQLIMGSDRFTEENGKRQCLLWLNKDIVPTTPLRHRPFQGWRYLDAEDAPSDLNEENLSDQMPAEMARELKELGLL